MSKYKYRICHDEKFWFELLPNNSNSWAVAKSSHYDTYDNAKNGMERFKRYMALNANKPLDSENIFIKGNSYQFCVYFTTLHDEFIKSRTCEKFNLKKAERRLRENYQVHLRPELNT